MGSGLDSRVSILDRLGSRSLDSRSSTGSILDHSILGTTAARARCSFDYEKLDCYRLAVSVNRWFSRAGFPRGRSHLRDQGLRASDSVVCNIAEGCSKKGTVGGKNQLLIALGSAGECCAVLDCVSL